MKNIVPVLATLAIAAIGVSVVAQQSTPPPTFRSGVSLATIDVTVLDKDGKPVPGLTADDIEIKLNGKAQPIRALTYVTAASPVAPATDKPAPAAAPVVAPVAPVRPDAPRRTLTNAGSPLSGSLAPAPVAAAAPPPAESRVFVLLVDDLSYSPQRGKAMFNSASRFIDRIPPSDPVGFATTTGVGAVNPTRDRAALKASLAKVVGAFNDPRGIGKSGPSPGAGCANTPDSPVGINEAIDIDRGNDTLLTDVVLRECFNNDRQGFNNNVPVGPQNAAFGGRGTSVAEMLGSCQCAHEVQRDAKRVAALARQNKGRQIEGIMSVIGAMKIASGIRHLVILTEGLPVSREVDELSPLVKAAAIAGVQLSVLLEEPDINLTDEGRRVVAAGAVPQSDTGNSRRRREDDQLLVTGAQTLTDMLGGTFYKVIGTADPSFDRVLVASSAVYRLGVELPAGAAPGKEFSVVASVKRPGVVAKANRLAVVAGADNVPAVAALSSKPAATDANGKPIDPSKIATGSVMVASADDVLKAALNSSVNTSDVPIRIASTLRRSSSVSGQVDVSVNVVIPASVKGPVTTFIGLVDPTNAMRSSRRVLEPSAGADYALPFLFPLAPGDYRVRFVASDSTGAIGTIDMPVHASLSALGEFTSSDVLTWVVDSGNKAQLFAIEDVPAGAATLNASLELYPSGAMPGEFPTIKWTLLREGDAKPIAEEETPARPASTLLRADVEFPFAALPPGTYTVRAELIVNDKAVGARAAIVKKK